MSASAIDWSALCDIGIEVRRRLVSKEPLVLTEAEGTALVVAALEYANRLAHEHGARLAVADGDCGCSAEWVGGKGCPALNCRRRAT